MSYEVILLNVRGRPRTLADLDVKTILPLGPAADVRRRISSVFSTVDWSAPALGVYQRDGYTIEIATGDEDLIQSITLHIHFGSDDAAIADILKLMRATGWA